jgi:Sec-independent protein translocase protein TatA
MYYLIILVILAVLYWIFVLPKMIKNAGKFYEEVKTQYTGKEEILRKELFDNTFTVQQTAFDTSFTSMAECENHRTGQEAAAELATRAAKTLVKKAVATGTAKKKTYHSFLAFDESKLYYIENEFGVAEISKQLSFDINKMNNTILDFSKISQTHALKFSYENKKYKFSVYDGVFPSLAGFGKSNQMETAKAKFALGDPFISRIKEISKK